MKKSFNFLLLLFFVFNSLFGIAQDGSRVDDQLGYRLKMGAYDERVWEDNDGKPSKTKWKKLNYRFFFRPVNVPEIKVGDITYVMITIPGTIKPADQDTSKLNINKAKTEEESGLPITEKDYGRNFWIDKSLLIKADTEHYKYRNDVCFGILTVPFKFRPEIGDSSSAIINGDLNIGSFLGWKVRLSSTRPLFICPVASFGVGSINYNSANNSKIKDSKSNVSSFSFNYCGGIVLDFYKIQTGIVVGADYGIGDYSKSYLYQNKAWFSIALNYNFLAYKKSLDVTTNK